MVKKAAKKAITNNSGKKKSVPKAQKKVGSTLSVFANKLFGEGTAVAPIELKSNIKEVLQIGLPHLERAVVKSVTTGDYGLPMGRAVTIFGPAKVGKTTFALEVAKSILLKEGIVIYIDQERTLTDEYVQKLYGRYGISQSVISENFIMMQPSKEMFEKGRRLTIEEIGVRLFAMFKKIRELRNKYGYFPVVIIWDSISATTSEAEVKRMTKKKTTKGDPKYDDAEASESTVKAAQPGSHSKAMRELFREIYDDVVETGAMLFLVAQKTSTIGYGSNTFLTKDAVSFATTVLLYIKRKEWIEDNGVRVGLKGEIEVRELKGRQPDIKMVEYKILFNEGYNFIYDLDKLVRKSGLVAATGEAEIAIDDIEFKYKMFDKLGREFEKLDPEGQHKFVRYFQDNYKAKTKLQEIMDEE